MRMLILPVVAALALTACGKKAEAPATETTTVAANENATGAVTTAAPAATGTPTVTNWSGRYVGKMPGADGKPADATLVLKDDGSYELTKVAAGAAAAKTSGKIGWGADGKTVVLDAAGGNAQVQIADGGAHVLDATGKPYTGADATVYVLRKR